MVGLDGFMARSSTHVTEQRNANQLVHQVALKVYLPIPDTFNKYCSGCNSLVMVQEADDRIRVFCAEEKCKNK